MAKQTMAASCGEASSATRRQDEKLKPQRDPPSPVTQRSTTRRALQLEGSILLMPSFQPPQEAAEISKDVRRHQISELLWETEELVFVGDGYGVDLISRANRVRFPAGSKLEFLHVGVLQEHAAGRRVYSGISNFPPLLNFRATTYPPRFIHSHRLSSSRRSFNNRPNISTLNNSSTALGTPTGVRCCLSTHEQRAWDIACESMCRMCVLSCLFPPPPPPGWDAHCMYAVECDQQQSLAAGLKAIQRRSPLNVSVKLHVKIPLRPSLSDSATFPTECIGETACKNTITSFTERFSDRRSPLNVSVKLHVKIPLRPSLSDSATFPTECISETACKNTITSFTERFSDALSVATRLPPRRSLFSHVGIVPDDTAGRRIFSGLSRFPRPCILVLLLTRFASPSLALKTSLLRLLHDAMARTARHATLSNPAGWQTWCGKENLEFDQFSSSLCACPRLITRLFQYGGRAVFIVPYDWQWYGDMSMTQRVSERSVNIRSGFYSPVRLSEWTGLSHSIPASVQSVVFKVNFHSGYFRTPRVQSGLKSYCERTICIVGVPPVWGAGGSGFESQRHSGCREPSRSGHRADRYWECESLEDRATLSDMCAKTTSQQRAESRKFRRQFPDQLSGRLPGWDNARLILARRFADSTFTSGHPLVRDNLTAPPPAKQLTLRLRLSDCSRPHLCPEDSFIHIRLSPTHPLTFSPCSLPLSNPTTALLIKSRHPLHSVHFSQQNIKYLNRHVKLSIQWLDYVPPSNATGFDSCRLPGFSLVGAVAFRPCSFLLKRVGWSGASKFKKRGSNMGDTNTHA
ncbi:hypothetical protein PR048_025074 [Dryococelus australis]|uniref:Uncharacterized protein n=1 Tax=Dryococelus australis TaxID=614101 RepID=A0ABQ9GQA0_9NEOP|nr:hypothetical protein PR048_025074 [Dryococelus australis]